MSESFLIKLQETSSQVFSREFCEILTNTYFVTYQRLLLNPRTDNTRNHLETMTIAKNLKHVTSENLFEEQFEERYLRISVDDLFLFKNLLNYELLVAGCTRFSKLRGKSRLCSGIFSFRNSK